MFRSPYADALIALIIVLLFLGPKRLPGLGRSLGEGMREFKDGITGGSKNGSSDRERAEIPAGQAASGQTQGGQPSAGQPAAPPPSAPAAGPQPTPAGTNTPPPADGAPAAGGQPASADEASPQVVQPPPPAPAGTEVGSERRS